MKFDAEKFRENLSARLRRQYGKDISQANSHDLFDAVSASVQELIMPAWMATRNAKKADQAVVLSFGRIFDGARALKQPHQSWNQR